MISLQNFTWKNTRAERARDHWQSHIERRQKFQLRNQTELCRPLKFHEMRFSHHKKPTDEKKETHRGEVSGREECGWARSGAPSRERAVCEVRRGARRRRMRVRPGRASARTHSLALSLRRRLQRRAAPCLRRYGNFSQPTWNTAAACLSCPP
jgi:hypothetical protein